VAGVTEIQVPLLQKCSAEGAALRSLADPCGARDSLLVLSALLWGQNSPLWVASTDSGSLLGGVQPAASPVILRTPTLSESAGEAACCGV